MYGGYSDYDYNHDWINELVFEKGSFMAMEDRIVDYEKVFPVAKGEIRYGFAASNY